MSSQSYSSSSLPRSRASRAKADLPTVAGVQVQIVAGRGVRCRQNGGFTRCPDAVFLDPRFAGHQGANKPKAPKSPREMVNGQMVQHVEKRGYRCRGPNGGRFVACDEETKRQLAEMYGEAAVFGKAKAIKSPMEQVNGVTVFWVRTRGWRCRDEFGGFAACPDDVFAILQNKPAPAGQEELSSRLAPAQAKARAAARKAAKASGSSASAASARSPSRSRSPSPARADQSVGRAYQSAGRAYQSAARAYQSSPSPARSIGRSSQSPVRAAQQYAPYSQQSPRSPSRGGQGPMRQPAQPTRRLVNRRNVGFAQ
ncbi:MAG: hypothetical protein WC208_14320 [Gallionella sp.]